MGTEMKGVYDLPVNIDPQTAPTRIVDPQPLIPRTS